MEGVCTVNGAPYWLYILQCDNRYYTGIATDPKRRCAEHISRGPKAAKFTRSAKSFEMKYARKIGEKGLALRVEYRIKRLSHAQKDLIALERPTKRSLLRIVGL